MHQDHANHFGFYPGIVTSRVFQEVVDTAASFNAGKTAVGDNEGEQRLTIAYRTLPCVAPELRRRCGLKKDCKKKATGPTNSIKITLNERIIGTRDAHEPA